MDLSQTVDPALVQAVGRALGAVGVPARRVGVGLSGGPDSAMLAVHAAAHLKQQGLPLYCLHVHHGLQDPATQWQGQARQLTQQLQAVWATRQVKVDLSRGDGMESAARTARYLALAQMARTHQLDVVLLAHHRDDQAETVLLRLLRGAGPAGLAAMRPETTRHGVVFVRPWLNVPRARIVQQAAHYAKACAWQAVQDPTNVQDDYQRGAIRTRLAPQLNARWPGWQAVLARHARQSAELSDLLAEVAAQDLARLDVHSADHSFSLLAWRGLSLARQALVLRHWLALAGHAAPTDARLQELMRQLRQVHALGHDRQLRVKHGDIWVCCVRGRVLLQPVNALQ